MEVQKIILKKIPMEGTVVKGDLKKPNISKKAVLSLTIGTIVLGSFAYSHHSQKINDNLTFSSNYKSYSAQIEELFDVDISSDREENLNKFENISLLVEEYKNEEDESKKAALREKVLAEKDNVEALSLYILKDEIAKKHGGEWTDYRISPEKADGTWKAYGNGNDITLNDSSYNLANSIGNFQSLGSTQEIQDVDDKKIISRYENLITETANFIKNASKKAK